MTPRAPTQAAQASETSPETTPQTTNWGAVLLLAFGGIFAAFHVGKLPPALPLIREELGLGLVMAGFVVSLFSLVGMLTAVILGGLADWMGRMRVVGLAYGCLALGGILGALSHSASLLLLGRALEGVGFIAASVSLPAVISASAKVKDRTVALGIWSLYTPLGMSTIMLASPVMLGQMGWRGMWWALVALCPLVAFFLLRQIKATPALPKGSSSVLRLAREGLTYPPFLLIGLVFGMYVLQWMTLMVWLPTFLTEVVGLSLPSAARATGGVVFVNAAGCIVGGWLLNRGASVGVLCATGAIGMGLCAWGIFGAPFGAEASAALRIALCVGFSFLGGLIPPTMFNCVPLVTPSPQHVGAGNGILIQGSATAQFVGPPLVAFAVAQGGGEWSYALVPFLPASAITLVAGLVLSAMISRR